MAGRGEKRRRRGAETLRFFWCEKSSENGVLSTFSGLKLTNFWRVGDFRVQRAPDAGEAR